MGGSVMLAIYPMDGKTVKKSAIHNILTLEEEIGKTIREAKDRNEDPIDEVLKLTNGHRLFQR